MSEIVHDVGFINSDCKHLMISVTNPTLTNVGTDCSKFIQIVLTLDNALELRDKLTAFIYANELDIG